MAGVIMVSSEVAPFAKTGGLGDVLGALPQALTEHGHDVRVIMPKYGCIEEKFVRDMSFLFYIYIPLGWRNQYCGVFSLLRNGITYYFIDNEYYFGDCQLYKWNDLERFAFFDKAVLETLKTLDLSPDIIHCNDWQTGMVPALLKSHYLNDPFFKNTKTVFTIHNLKYQGIFEIDSVRDFFSLDASYFTNDKIEFHGSANLLKAGIVYSDIITTVSPTYAGEIKSFPNGEGLDGLLRARENSLFGIINGIDYNEYSPASNQDIFCNYNHETHAEGKRKNKTCLQEQLGLPIDGDKAVIGLVSRLVSQKGFDIILEAMPSLLNMDLQIVFLGTGDKNFENALSDYAWYNSDKVSANIYFSNEMANKIYAASDLFLMPSLFEPCGLSQLIALSYGSIPIVRETGGLKDTVLSYNEYTNEGNGFSFSPYSAHDLIYTVNRALSFFADKPLWNALVSRCMQNDFSWKESAKKYSELYQNLIY